MFNVTSLSCSLQVLGISQDIEAIIFDCDGVIVDTEGLKFQAWRESLALFSIKIDKNDYISHVGKSGKGILNGICRSKDLHLEDAIKDKILTEKKVCYEKLQKNGIRAIEPALKVLRQLDVLQKKGEIRLALASSAGRNEILENLKQHDICDCFEFILSGKDDLDEYQDPEGKNKPKPYIYLKALNLLGVSAEKSLVFEDTNSGVEAAFHAGCHVIAIPNEWTISHNFSRATSCLDGFDDPNFMIHFQLED